MLSVLTAYMFTVCVFLILPSPIDLVIMNGANRYGFKGAFFTVMATNAASLVWIAAAGLLLAGAGSISETFLDTLTGVGGLYLVYYGWGMWRDARRNIATNWMQAMSAQAPQSLRKMMVEAFGVGISSPKDIIFFMTFFPPFIGQLDMGLLPALLLLTLIWCVFDYVILIAYGMGLAKLITPRREALVLRISAVIFWGIGLYAAWLGLRVWLA